MRRTWTKPKPLQCPVSSSGSCTSSTVPNGSKTWVFIKQKYHTITQKRKIDESYLQGTWWSWLTVHQPQTIIVNSVIKLLHFTVVIVKTSPYLTKLIFCHVKMEIANIQPSGSTWIGTSASTWCSSNGWIRLNKILFSFWRFNHDRLTKKRLSRECYCHRYRHYIIKFNIPATKTVLYQEELIKDMHIHVNTITNKKQENIKSSRNLMYVHAHAIRRDKTY